MQEIYPERTNRSVAGQRPLLDALHRLEGRAGHTIKQSTRMAIEGALYVGAMMIVAQQIVQNPPKLPW